MNTKTKRQIGRSNLIRLVSLFFSCRATTWCYFHGLVWTRNEENAQDGIWILNEKSNINLYSKGRANTLMCSKKDLSANFIFTYIFDVVKNIHKSRQIKYFLRALYARNVASSSTSILFYYHILMWEGRCSIQPWHQWASAGRRGHCPIYAILADLFLQLWLHVIKHRQYTPVFHFFSPALLSLSRVLVRIGMQYVLACMLFSHSY